MKTFTCNFIGQKAGSMGRSYRIEVDVRAKDEHEVKYILSCMYETVGDVRITEKKK